MVNPLRTSRRAPFCGHFCLTIVQGSPGLTGDGFGSRLSQQAPSAFPLNIGIRGQLFNERRNRSLVTRDGPINDRLNPW
jgi:hypothetical protein